MVSQQYIMPFEAPANMRFVGGWLFSSSGMTYLFNPVAGSSLVLPDEFAEPLTKGVIPESLELKLTQRGFITMEGVEAVEVGREARIRPGFFLIDLTKSCNCRCLYCFRDLHQQKSIAPQTLDDILSHIVSYCKQTGLKRITVQPWGGEPLLRWTEVKRIQDVIRDAGIELDLLLETNALSLTEEIAREAFSRNIKISVSIDGFEQVHDGHRKLRGGGNSFATVMANLQHLSSAGYGGQFGVVCVATSHSLACVERIIEFFAVELGIPRVKINMVKDNPVMRSKELCIAKEDIPDLQRRILAKVVELNAAGISFGESNIVDRLHNLLTRKTRNLCNSRGCQAGKRMLSFGMDGGIYPCDLTDAGELKLGNIYDDEGLTDLLERNRAQGHPFFVDREKADCRVCPWHIFCRGGCTATMFHHGERGGVDESDCVRNRTLYPLLVDLILTRPHLIASITGNEISVG